MNKKRIRINAEKISLGKGSAALARECRRYGFHYLGSGITRSVYLDLQNCVVYKLALSDEDRRYNYSEMTAWRCMPENLRSLFAEGIYLSKNHRVLVSEFVDFTLKEIADPRIEARFERLIEKHGLDKIIYDSHCENVGINYTGYYKILDYAFIAGAENLGRKHFVKSVKTNLNKLSSRIGKTLELRLTRKEIDKHLVPFV